MPVITSEYHSGASSLERAATRSRPGRAFGVVLLVSLVAVITSCGKPFNVKTAPDTRPRAFAAIAESSGIALQAEAITDEDLLYDTFDANLIMAGLLPVRLKVTNAGAYPISLRDAKFEIRQPNGRGTRTINPRRAFKRLIMFYEVSTYQIKGYKQSEQDFASHALDVGSPLNAGASRDGLLFFAVEEDTVSASGLTLVVRRVRTGKANGNVRLELKLK